MRESLVRWIGVGVFAGMVIAWCGCIAPYDRKQVQIRVVDLATWQPIEKAAVTVTYSGMYEWNHPDPQHAVTDAHGRTNMWLATYDGRIQWQAAKDGYVTAVGAAFVGKQAPSNWRGTPFLITDGVVNTVSLMRLPMSEPR